MQKIIMFTSECLKFISGSSNASVLFEFEIKKKNTTINENRGTSRQNYIFPIFRITRHITIEKFAHRAGTHCLEISNVSANVATATPTNQNILRQD